MPPTRKSPAPAQEESEWGDEVGSGTLVKWDAPKVIIGTYQSREMRMGKYGLKPRVSLIDDEGNELAFFPPSILDSRLMQVEIGSRVRIEYDGTSIPSKTVGAQPAKNFTVRVSKNGLHAQAFAKTDEVPF